jgi:hypothetical protein
MTEQQLRIVRNAPARYARLLEEYREKLATVDARWDLPTDSKVKGRELVRRDAREQAKRISDEVARAEATIRKSIATHRSMPSPALSSTGSLAATAFLEAVKSSDAPEAFVRRRLKRAVEKGEVDLLHGARAALADTLESRGVELAPDLVELLDEHGGPPEAAEALAFEREFTPGAYRVGVAAAFAQEELDDNVDRFAPNTVLPGFAKDEILVLADPPEAE